MTAAMILQMLGLAEQLFTTASSAYTSIKADVDATTQAQISAAVTSSGQALDAARAALDADAA